MNQLTSLGRREFLGLTAFSWLWPPNWFSSSASIAGIEFKVIETQPAERHFIWIHGNERTAREVLLGHMKDGRGKAFVIQSENRNVPLLGGQIDPNRMFSREGAEKNLRRLNPEWTPVQLTRALEKLDSDRPHFVAQILPPGGRVLIALHNNGPAYSIEDEIPISDEVARNDREHPDEFLLCTQRPDFQVLAGGPFNVVLQNKVPPDDDGSLSRLCAARGVRYVNIEAALGNAAAQKRMLDWAVSVL